LFSEAHPAIYVYHQEFTDGGISHTRRGFLCRVRLEPFGEGSIYPHEETHGGPKADRLKLWRACRANLSPIFGLYPDEENAAQDALESAVADVAPLEATDHLGVVHRLWPVIDAPVDNSRSMQLFRAAPSVLVVDDNRDAADSLAAFLHMNGISVTVAYEGPEATELAEKLRPDVIVLDIGMPHVDGLAVATWIRSKPWGSSVRLIALTGWGQPSDRARTRTAGFDLHLVKPVDPDHLMMHLRAMSAASEVAMGA
jgi:CheY-like chemotaxis protein